MNFKLLIAASEGLILISKLFVLFSLILIHKLVLLIKGREKEDLVPGKFISLIKSNKLVVLIKL